MGLDEGIFVNRDCFRTFPQLLCSICRKVTEDPREGGCGHSFCKGCVDDLLRRNFSSSCPSCSSPLSSLKPSPLLSSMLAQLDTICYHCSWSGPLSLRPSHLLSCEGYQESLRRSSSLSSSSDRNSASFWDYPQKGSKSSSSPLFVVEEEFEIDDSPHGIPPTIPQRHPRSSSSTSTSFGLPASHRFPVAKATVSPSGLLLCTNCGGTKAGDVDPITRLCSWCTKWG